MWLCGNCDAANEEKDSHCVVCDRVRINDMTGKFQFCMECGTKYVVSPDARFCINCGCKLLNV